MHNGSKRDNAQREPEQREQTQVSWQTDALGPFSEAPSSPVATATELATTEVKGGTVCRRSAPLTDRSSPSSDLGLRQEVLGARLGEGRETGG
jgi:hypothetical protein